MLKDISTEMLLEELVTRDNVKNFDACGIYQKYSVEIKEKYSKKRTPEELPKEFQTIVITRD